MMSQYAQDAFIRSPLLVLPLIALVVFATVWSVTAIRAFRMRRSDVDRFSRMPLDAEQPEISNALLQDERGKRHG